MSDVETHVCGFCRGSGRLPHRPGVAAVMRACRSLAASGKPITSAAVWRFVEGRVQQATISNALSRLEEQGSLRKVARVRNGKGLAFTYALDAREGNR